MEKLKLKKDTYFKDLNNNIYFFEKDTEFKFISKDLMEISDDKALELIAPSLETLKKQKIYQVKNHYIKNVSKVINFEGNSFNSDDKSLLNLKNILELNKKSYEIITSDNKIVKLSKEDLKKLILKIIENLYNFTLECRKLKNDILTSENEDKINYLLNEKGLK